MQKIEYQHTAGDSRMLYGMGGPLLAAVALIVGCFLIGEVWLIPLMMIAVFALTGLVLWGFSHMLDEDGDEPEGELS
jgi:archaellum biogenesis protein FlaJ (TadC family)